MTERIGQQIGHYRLIRKLGTGGFADVYQAEHIHLNTPAAVKLLHANLASRDMQSFRDEARTIAHLEHPHIVRVWDFDIADNVPYLVMEYAPNGTLRQRHPGGSQVPLPLVVMYVKQLASALHYAHTRRLIHRDVKPENILLGSHNELLLGDFGAALITRTSLRLGEQDIIGTAAYMAPEQLRGRPTFASDQYALGIVAYEWLCGHCPFRGSLAELHNLQLYEPPPPLCPMVPALPFAVEQVIMKALAKQPDQRFATIQAFADALELASKSLQATPAPLFLPGDGGTRAAVTLLATKTMPVPPPSLPPMPAPAPLPPKALPVTMVAKPPAGPRLMRRAFLALGLVAIGGSGLAWWLALRGQSTSANTPKSPTKHLAPTATPRPTPTPVPSKSNAFYTHTSQDKVFTAAWSPDGAYIASAGGNTDTRYGDNAVHIWTMQSSQDAYTYPDHTALVRMVAWSPDGKRLASASEDGTVRVWDALSGNNPVMYRGHSDKVMALTWSPDGTLIASASNDSTVQIWDATQGNHIFTYNNHNNVVTSVVWSPDGKLIASGGVDKMVYVWSTATGETLHSFPHASRIGALAWSPDGRYLATGDYNPDDSVRIWDISTNHNVQTLPGGFHNLIYSVAWSPDNKYIAAGCDNNEVKIWHLATSELIFIYQGHSKPVMSVQWSPDGKYIASGSFDGTVQVWTSP